MWCPATTKVAVFALVSLSTAFPSSCERRLVLSGSMFMERNQTPPSSIEIGRLSTSLDQPPASIETSVPLKQPPPSVKKDVEILCPCKLGTDVTYISLYGKRFKAKVESKHTVDDFTQRGYTLSFPGSKKSSKRVRCFKVRCKPMEAKEALPGSLPAEDWPKWPTATPKHEANTNILKEGLAESSMTSKFWDSDSFILARKSKYFNTGLYRDTTFRFPCDKNKCEEKGKKLVALTLHDGLMEHYDDDGVALSIVNFLRNLLKHHGAKATIFLIGKYFMPHWQAKDTDSNKKEQARLAFNGFLEDGHEFGNHNMKDRFYNMDGAGSFEKDLTELQEGIETFTSDFHKTRKQINLQKQLNLQIRASASDGIRNKPNLTISPHVQPEKMPEKIKWYSPPKAVMSYAMRDVLKENGFQTVIGSAYAEDWSISNSEFIAQTLLKQAKTAGSIIILHLPGLSMPNPGSLDGLKARFGMKVEPKQVEAYWWWTLHALEKLLIYLKENGFATTTLSDLAKRSSA